MLYELAHVIKDRFTFLWEAVEKCNALLFSLKYKKKLEGVSQVLKNVNIENFVIRETALSDVKKLEVFFSEQPEQAFNYFRPHGFDELSILKVIRNKSFQTFVVTENDNVVGYFFLRSFVNGKCFRGRMVDFRNRGRGIGKLMAVAIEKVVIYEGLRMYASISPDNLASLNSAKAVSDINIIKVLDNGYYYIECTPKIKN